MSSVGLLDVRPGAVTKAHGTHGAFRLGLQALHSRKELISLRLRELLWAGILITQGMLHGEAGLSVRTGSNDEVLRGLSSTSLFSTEVSRAEVVGKEWLNQLNTFVLQQRLEPLRKGIRTRSVWV